MENRLQPQSKIGIILRMKCSVNSTSFRRHHTLQILERFSIGKIPLDVFLKNYFLENRAIGSKDRKLICDKIYTLIRWSGLIDFLAERPLSSTSRLNALENFSPKQFQNDASIPAHVRVSFPKKLYEKIREALGDQEAFEFCWDSNFPAPITIRVNALKISREDFFQNWQEFCPMVLCQKASQGITLLKKIDLRGTEEFKKGFFEIQDEASQLIAQLISAHPEHCLGDRVLDYCAGAGGKALAIAASMKNRGQLYLHDVRPFALEEARKRLKRAGVQNAQTISALALQKLRGSQYFKWVLVDAPCSGSGTFRRNPDMKWRFDPQEFSILLESQSKILDEAVNYVEPGGFLVYATCSILPEENEKQIEALLARFPSLRVEGPFLKTCFRSPLPENSSERAEWDEKEDRREERMDGFFGAILRKEREPQGKTF